MVTHGAIQWGEKIPGHRSGIHSQFPSFDDLFVAYKSEEIL